MTQPALFNTPTADFGKGTKAVLNGLPVEIVFVGAGKSRQVQYRKPGEPEPIKRWVITDDLRPYDITPLADLPPAPLTEAPAPDEPAAPAAKEPAKPRNTPNVQAGQLKAGDRVKTRRGRIGLVTTGEHDRRIRVDVGKFTTAHYVETLELLPPDGEVERLKAEIATLTAQRDKLLTDPVRLQVKQLQQKLEAAESEKASKEKLALQHEAELLAKLAAAQAEARQWREELKAVELGQPVTPPPAPSVLKTEIKTLVQELYPNECGTSDAEFAQYLNEGWEILHINTTSSWYDERAWPQRHITLKRMVQLPAFPPQPTARTAADLAAEFVAALEDEEPVIDPADLDTELDPVVPISQFAITPEEQAALVKLHTAPEAEIQRLPDRQHEFLLALSAGRNVVKNAATRKALVDKGFITIADRSGWDCRLTDAGRAYISQHTPKQQIILPQERPSRLQRLIPDFAQRFPIGDELHRDGLDALQDRQNTEVMTAARAAYAAALQRTRTLPTALLPSEVSS